MNTQCLRFGPARRLAAVFVLAALAGPAAIASAPQASVDAAAVRAAALAKHNALRARHGSPSMTLDETLNRSAQAWADRLAASGEFAHSAPDAREDAGENIYVSFAGAGADPVAFAEEAVQSWYDEVQAHDYSNEAFSPNSGHFTQVVWRGSTRLGVGVALGNRAPDGSERETLFLVCRYSPAGNTRGGFAANVRPPGAAPQAPAGPPAPAPKPAPGSAPGGAPRLAEVTFKELPAEGQGMGAITLVTQQLEGEISVEVNGREVSPPLEAIVRTDKGFVRVKGRRRDLNVQRGANTVVLVVDGVRSAPATFTY